MTEHVYKTIELTGSSYAGIEDAAQKAVDRAGKTLHNLRWFVITDTRGVVDRDSKLLWQVTIKAGFTLDE
ncbi:MAG: dodecin [Spongiibacteraceae bacterium]